MEHNEIAECQEDLDWLLASINARLLRQMPVYQWEYEHADFLRRRIKSLKEDNIDRTRQH